MFTSVVRGGRALSLIAAMAVVSVGAEARADCISVISSCLCLPLTTIREAVEVEVLAPQTPPFVLVEVIRQVLPVGPLEPGDTFRVEIMDAEVGERWMLLLDENGQERSMFRLEENGARCRGHRFRQSPETLAGLATDPACDTRARQEGIREPSCNDTVAPPGCAQMDASTGALCMLIAAALARRRRAQVMTIPRS